MRVQAILEPSEVLVENQVEETQRTSRAFADYLEKETGSYADALDRIFEKAARQYGVDKDLLLAMGKAESNFQNSATSRSGAQGIMQLMPGTAAGLGVTDAYDPEQNIMGGARYISQLIDKYGGRLSYAIAAYNAGSGNVDKYGGVPPFSETQAYVAKVLKYMEEGVSIPDTLSASKETEQAAKSSAVENTTGTDSVSEALGSLSDLSFRKVMEKYFDYDDYLEFIQLFSKLLYEKITGKSILEKKAESVQDDSDFVQAAEQASNTKKAEEEKEEEGQAVRQMSMTVHSNGISKVYYQDTEEEMAGSPNATSDAYIAYQNMVRAKKNCIFIQLMPEGVQDI